MIKIAPVNYTNTYPLLYKMDDLMAKYDIELVPMIPSAIPAAVQSGAVDLGLAPVAGLSMIDSPRLVGDYGIASEWEVASVALFSDVPIEEIEEVLLDFHSRTSVRLLKWLFRYRWQREVKYLATSDDDYMQEIQGSRAGLVIGDRAFDMLGAKPYIYDLSGEWRAETDLPFVFATWVSRRDLDSEFLEDFESAQAAGVEQIAEVINHHKLQNHSYDMYRYYTENISYRLGPDHRKAIKRFLEDLV